MFRITKKTMALVAVCALAMVSALSQAANPASDFNYDLADDNVSVIITKYKGNAKNVVIPSEIEGLPVSTLGADVFYENKTIESVVMPDTIKLIGTYKDYKGPSDAVYFYYYSNCFRRCSNLKSVIISKNITSIPTYCFDDCTSLENIVLPDGLKYIGGAAFEGCAALKTVKFPDSLEEFGTVYYRYPDYASDAIYYGSYAFSRTGLTHIELPDALTKIPTAIFTNCESLVSVKIGKNTKVIGSYAFAECESLSSINFGNVEEIGEYAFRECTSLEKIELPETIKSIDGKAFSGCSKLSEIIIPASVEKISFPKPDYKKNENIFLGTNFNLATKAKLRALGYKGEF